MSEEAKVTINTAQPTDALTAQPNHGRVLTETVQPRAAADSPQVPILISGVAPAPQPIETSTSSQQAPAPAPPASQPAEK